jgi:RsmE family RNA methyltransferase
MNLILLQDNDFTSANRVILRDRQAEHVRTVHRAQEGDNLRVGLLNGDLGNGRIVALNKATVELEVQLKDPPPKPLDLTLLLALPRPKMLKRILQTVTAMGVKRIYLINSYRVEKSFWNSPLLQPQQLTEQLILGLEQARDTLLPEIELRKRFKPFVEDELPKIIGQSTAFVAHPGADTHCPHHFDTTATLAIGPEGGFIPYEIEKLQECGFNNISLGPRILRVETAVPVLLSRFSAI